jgi:hypothetical protein
MAGGAGRELGGTVDVCSMNRPTAKPQPQAIPPAGCPLRKHDWLRFGFPAFVRQLTEMT